MSVKDSLWLALCASVVALLAFKPIGVIRVPARVDARLKIEIKATIPPIIVRMPSIPPLKLKVEGTPTVTITITPIPESYVQDPR